MTEFDIGQLKVAPHSVVVVRGQRRMGPHAAEQFVNAIKKASGHEDFVVLLADVGASVEVRPVIVCLCGSTRFYEAFQRANYELTMAGEIVLSVGFYPHSQSEAGHGEGVGHDSEEKVKLDELHKRKIDLADYIYVLNVGGYIGPSTRSEIEYARALGKHVEYLEP